MAISKKVNNSKAATYASQDTTLTIVHLNTLNNESISPVSG